MFHLIQRKQKNLFWVLPLSFFFLSSVQAQNSTSEPKISPSSEHMVQVLMEENLTLLDQVLRETEKNEIYSKDIFLWAGLGGAIVGSSLWVSMRFEPAAQYFKAWEKVHGDENFKMLALEKGEFQKAIQAMEDWLKHDRNLFSQVSFKRTSIDFAAAKKAISQARWARRIKPVGIGGLILSGVVLVYGGVQKVYPTSPLTPLSKYKNVKIGQSASREEKIQFVTQLAGVLASQKTVLSLDPRLEASFQKAQKPEEVKTFVGLVAASTVLKAELERLEKKKDVSKAHEE